MASRPGALAVAKGSVAGRVHFEGVGFSYPGTAARVLRDIDLEVEPGEVIALVGRSGAGKTTLCNLIARFYDPTEGTIRLDGLDLRDIKVESYRRLLGIVEQDVFLFDGTVAENIAYADRRATRADVERAAHAAHAAEFIESLPEGYDTTIGERGFRLSGGQRQRLAIARAVLADPRIFILDEATSNLDSQSERLIQRSLAALMRGRTSFVIAHRLSTIRRADRILVLDTGAIVEVGSHAELMARSGQYREYGRAATARGGRLTLCAGKTGHIVRRALTRPARPRECGKGRSKGRRRHEDTAGDWAPDVGTKNLSGGRVPARFRQGLTASSLSVRRPVGVRMDSTLSLPRWTKEIPDARRQGGTPRDDGRPIEGDPRRGWTGSDRPDDAIRHLSVTGRVLMIEKLILPEIRELIEAGDLTTLGDVMNRWLPADLAGVVANLSEEEALKIVRLVEPPLSSEMFEYLEWSTQQYLLDELTEQESASLLEGMAADDRTALLEELPRERAERLIELLSPEQREVARSLLQYSKDTVGRLMTPDFVAIRKEWTIKHVLDHVRTHGRDSETLNAIYVVDNANRLIDELRIREVLLAPLHAHVRDIMDNQFVALHATDDKKNAVEVFRKYDRTARPSSTREGRSSGS